jgi:hypothetical protein
MIYNEVNPYELDWGTASAEGFHEERKTLLLVFNIDISSLINVYRCVIFITGRSIWLNRQLPEMTQKVVLDLRGQSLTLLDRARQMKKNILQNLSILDCEIIIEILI